MKGLEKSTVYSLHIMINNWQSFLKSSIENEDLLSKYIHTSIILTVHSTLPIVCLSAVMVAMATGYYVCHIFT